jgi:NAD(P)-dependent dehydrogenase (short-subunit alcohol dehydrogenase family)
VNFRDDLLAGRRLAIAGGAAMAVHEQMHALGAWVESIGDETMLEDEPAAAAWFARRAPLDGLVVCAGESFGPGGAERMRGSLELAWRCARAAATGALIPTGRPARLLFVAPAPDAGPYAEAARAALENLARTLSVEWARFSITSVALAPGPATTDAELAALSCFLVSPAGGYFSGCRFDLGAVAVAGEAR